MNQRAATTRFGPRRRRVGRRATARRRTARRPWRRVVSGAAVVRPEMRERPGAHRAERLAISCGSHTPAGKFDSRVNFDREAPLTAETLATQRDERHLLRAVELAAEARGQTSPNPLVGRRHRQERPHDRRGLPPRRRPAARRAEALAACSEDPAGATMYVSLEPCATMGRTPPCTEAIVEARIARVVVASDDPPARPPAAASGSCATRVSRWRCSTARSASPPGCSTSRSASTRTPAARWSS